MSHLQDLDRLVAALNRVIPAKRRGNLMLASWNIQAFGGLAATWVSGPEHSPKRDWHAVHCIAVGPTGTASPTFGPQRKVATMRRCLA